MISDFPYLKSHQLRHPIVIEKRAEGISEWNREESPIWEPIHACRAYIKPIFGYHAVTGAGLVGLPLEERSFYQITIRYTERLEVGMRVRYRNQRPMMIKRLIDPDQRQRQLMLLAEKEKPEEKTKGGQNESHTQSDITASS